MRTLYIAKTSEFQILGSTYHDAVYGLFADDGEHLASHVCSSPGFARGDLHDRRKERQEEWRERFGEYEVRWLGEDEMTETELLRRNQAWAAKQPDPDPARRDGEGA